MALHFLVASYSEAVATTTFVEIFRRGNQYVVAVSTFPRSVQYWRQDAYDPCLHLNICGSVDMVDAR